MMTLRQLAAEPPMLPTHTTWYLTDLAEARGKQELFTRQSPQKLKVLPEHALIESAISSNRIEGVEVDKSRVRTLIFGKPALRDRDEEEVRGYRDALKLIHESDAKLRINETTIKRLHKLCRGEIWDAGAYKEKDVDITSRNYEVLEQSSQHWHDGRHDPWPTINFLLFILTQACKEFEERVGQLKSPRGHRTEAVLAAVGRQISTFRVADLQAECPGVGLDLIRHILARLQKEKEVRAFGTGRSTNWQKLGN